MKGMTPEAAATRLLASDKFHRAYLGDDPPPTPAQVGAVLHALADHTLIAHLCSADVEAMGEPDPGHVRLWPQITGIGRFLQAMADAAADGPVPDPWEPTGFYRAVDGTGRVLTEGSHTLWTYATAASTPGGRLLRLYRATETVQWREVPNDVRPLPEDISDHAMGPFHEHDDGRFCGYHNRLRVWAADAWVECTRTHPTPGEVAGVSTD